SYTLTAVAALLVTCHVLHKHPEIPGLPGIPRLPRGDVVKMGTQSWEHTGNFILHVGHLLPMEICMKKVSTFTHSLVLLDCITFIFICVGLPRSLDTGLHKDLVNLKHRLSRLDSVLALNGEIREVGEKILASNWKKADFASALESCNEAGQTLATPMNEEENKAILSIVKQYNQYAYLGIREGETSGQFNCVNSTPLNYTMWHQYKSNGKGTEKDAEMYNDASCDDKLQPHNCELYRLTICEFQGMAFQPPQTELYQVTYRRHLVTLHLDPSHIICQWSKMTVVFTSTDHTVCR
ncbi:LOW QUALITY PROTEIN: pulmonary surfactant-associated protein A-like, partial [Leptosomus discolor]